MKVELATVGQMYITQVPSLDPIDVYLKDFPSGTGQITIVCFGAAWSAYFNAIGNKTIREFFLGCENDYLITKFMCPSNKQTSTQKKYLGRVLDAVKEAMRRC